MPGASKVVRTFDMGTRHGAHITGEVLMTPQTPRSGSYSVRFKVKGADGSARIMQADVGVSTDRNFEARAGDFTRSGHRQLFLSYAYQAAGGDIFDCDGECLRRLYNQNVGRVWTSMYRDAHGRWHIRETWPRHQWDDHGDLGVGYGRGTNTVTRTLHWSGHAWTPDRPGKSRIVRASR